MNNLTFNPLEQELYRVNKQRDKPKYEDSFFGQNFAELMMGLYAGVNNGKGLFSTPLVTPIYIGAGALIKYVMGNLFINSNKKFYLKTLKSNLKFKELYSDTKMIAEEELKENNEEIDFCFNNIFPTKEYAILNERVNTSLGAGILGYLAGQIVSKLI